MGDAITVVKLLETAGNVSVVALVLIAVWAFFSGRVPTPREFRDAQQRAQEERERVEAKDREAKAAHERLDKLAETLPDLADSIQSIDKRLDMHGFPQTEPRKKRRWPWERE